MPFINPPSGKPSISQSKFFVPSLLGTTVSPSSNTSIVRLASFVTRFGKKLKQRIKRFAHFTTFNTGVQPVTFIVKFQSRVRRSLKKATFKLRKLAIFTPVWHLGVDINVIKIKTRVRRSLKKANFQLRKFARFAVWHTGLQPSIQVIKFQTRIRRTLAKRSFQLRKIARFSLWHFTAVQPDINHNVLNLSTRRSLRDKRRKGKNARFFPLYETGLQPVSLFLRLKARRTIRSKSSYQYRKIAHLAIWHFTPAAGGGTRREWVSPRTGHSRGDQ